MRIETSLIGVTRRLNTISGNPRFKLMTDRGAFETAADAQCNYDVKDSLEADYPRDVVLMTDERNLVTGIEYV